MKICSYLFLLLFISVNVYAQQEPAFKGAEGFGAYAKGGKGGSTYHVTNLNDEGAGSFRDAVSMGDRIIVFDVAGVIKIKSPVSVKSNITISGETAPKGGITVYGFPVSFSRSNDIIVRNIRFRGSINMARGSCTVHADSSKNIMFDHVSIEWGRWDNLHIKESSDITLQYCIIGEAIDPQRFGALLENPVRLTIHHCLWIDNQSRNPKAKAGIEFINNVVYNFGAGGGFVGGHSSADHYQDVVGNYFIGGPNSKENYLSMFTATDHVYQSGNRVDLNKDGKLNGEVVQDSSFANLGATLVKEKQNIPPVAVSVDNAEDAYKKIVKEAGPKDRDKIDNRLISWLQSLGTKGEIYKNEMDAGGQDE